MNIISAKKIRVCDRQTTYEKDLEIDHLDDVYQKTLM